MKPPESLTSQTATGVAWSGASILGRQILSFISVSILARLLPPSAYGLIGMASLVIAFLLNFRDLGTAAAIIQKKELPDELLSTIFWLNITFGLALWMLSLLVAFPVSEFFHEPELARILKVLAFSFCFTAAGIVHSSLLSRHMQFNRIAAADFSAAVVGTAVGVGLALRGAGVWSLVFATLANSATSCLCLWYQNPWRPRFVLSLRQVRSVARFSLNFSGFGLVNYFARNADNAIVGRMLGATPLGFYQMAYNVFLYPLQNITGTVGQVTYPAMSKLQDENDRLRAAYLRVVRTIALVSFPVMAGLAVVADPFVRVILGTKWTPIIPLLQVFSIVGLVQSVQGSAGQIYTSKGRTDWMFRWSLIWTPSAIAAFLIGIKWGIFGVAVAYAIAVVVFLYPSLAIPFHLIQLRFRDYARVLLPQARATTVMSLCSLLWLRMLATFGMEQPPVRLFTTVLIGAFAYVAYIRLVERRFLREILEDIRNMRSSWGHILGKILFVS